MDRLRVRTTDLDGFAGLVRRAADDATEATGYVAKFGTIPQGELGLFTRLLDLHGDLHQDVKSTMERLRTILDGSSRELCNSARYYHETDHAVAASMDAQHPAPRR
ncbi:type VII secretion target [Streptomyces sp. NPDC051993]|uniref:type VII secretion target n=1 Tax=Streptomyces sp. NPDC051993 TaxID=3155286 RepID=UPI003431DBC8